MSAIKIISLSAIALWAAATCSCSGSGATASAARSHHDTIAVRGAFSGDSAMAMAERQVAFGPRVPGTDAHGRCVDWLVDRLTTCGADTVEVLESSATAWDGTRLPVRNILARFNADSPARILLLAHYDTRPWADQETDAAKRELPIDGANDGASGVAVLLEIARNLGLEPAATGVDILLTDCEDYGRRADTTTEADSFDDSWALGAAHFAKRLPYTAANMPRFGILLDMVGGRDARFPHEYFSANLAQAPTAKVWNMARRLGLADRFPAQLGGAVNDDHIPLIQAGIPVADIIENANPQTGSFPPTWHTHLDNIEHLDAATMHDVGTVVLNVIYNEKP